MTTYKIIRFHRDSDEKEVIETGLTLDEAQAWCQRDDTHGDDWFDGYNEEATQVAGYTTVTTADGQHRIPDLWLAGNQLAHPEDPSIESAIERWLLQEKLAQKERYA